MISTVAFIHAFVHSISPDFTADQRVDNPC